MSYVRKQPRSAIGLDIGARRIKAVQLEPLGASTDDGVPAAWRVTAATTFNRTAPGQPISADEAARVCDTLDRLGFAGTRVVMAAPADKLIVGMLELPKAGGIPLTQIARVELARTSKSAPDSFEMGCWELPVPARAGKTVQVMAVGYPHAEAAQFLDVIESAGLDVTVLDVRSCAIARACASAVAPQPGITALLDVGWSSASLVLVYSGMVVYVRALGEAGISRLYESLAKRLKLDAEVVDYVLGELGLRDPATVAAVAAPADVSTTDSNPREAEAAIADVRLELPSDARSQLTNYADALVRELLVSFSYVARQYTDASVTRLLLMGAGAPIPGLAEHLSKELGLETRLVAPKDLAECPSPLLETCSSPELTPALGLAQFPET
jgi:Tfp pilus assembly PilM family ATPase